MALHVLDEANRCLGCKKPMCQQGCPIHTNIPEVIRLLKANELDAAGRMLFENNPLTTVCSLVCNHENQCEGHCIRNRMPSHDPVHFSIIEDYISTTYANKMTKGPAPKNGMKAAVVGAGPAGLTIAVLLARWGYDITIFDARDKIGGVMRYGIPNYRLPDSVLDDFAYRHLELKDIKVRTNTAIGRTITIDDLFRDGYKSVYIGAGLWKANAMHIKGETLGNVAFGIDYLANSKAFRLGDDIAVIGEGVRKVYEEILVPAGMGDVALYTELGRFMLAPYGHLVTRTIHEKHIYKEYIGTDACACDLMRPAMYGSYHHITVMGKEEAPCDHKYDIVGGLCENNDKFAVDRMLPRIDIGDLLVIHDAGAHGLAMGYNYNGKLRCAEVLLQPDGSTRLIRRAETPEDYFATMIWDD